MGEGTKQVTRTKAVVDPSVPGKRALPGYLTSGVEDDARKP